MTTKNNTVKIKGWNANLLAITKFSPEVLTKVETEVKKIQEDLYCVSEVSQDMKDVINAVFGDDDYSTSGYWVRAETLVATLSRS